MLILAGRSYLPLGNGRAYFFKSANLDGRLKKRRGPLSLEKGENTHSLLMHQAGPVSVKGKEGGGVARGLIFQPVARFSA